MKSFIIKAPAKGKTTCTLVRQYYDKESRRTKTQYLGSFNMGIDRAKLPAGIHLRPDVELNEEQSAEIATWLLHNGTFGRQPLLSDEILELARNQLVDVMHEQFFHVEPQSDLDLASSVLHGAALELQHTAAKLRERGLELSPGLLTYTGIDSAKCLNDLDQLKVQSNKIRSAAIQFEEALKEAKLMKRLNKVAKVGKHAI
ncbi:MAG: hypothetical protein RJA34_1992 [Pseudomonadota bacterium]|jgi:hypothetical protein